VYTCRNVVVTGARGRGRSKENWQEFIKLDLKSSSLSSSVLSERARQPVD